MTVKIYSTLSTHQEYASYGPSQKGGLPALVKKVFVSGGANVATKSLTTPPGVLTVISEEDFEHLKSNHTFQRHEQNGFIQIRRDKVDPEVAVVNMKRRDESAPVTPENSDEMLSGTEVKPMDGSADEVPVGGKKKRGD